MTTVRQRNARWKGWMSRTVVFTIEWAGNGSRLTKLVSNPSAVLHAISRHIRRPTRRNPQ